jgi:hypothetical protein
MELSTLKNVSVSALILFFIGCEDTRFEEGTPVDDSYGTVYVSVESVPSIELNDYSWQTLKTLYGDLASDDANIMNVRIEWESDMFWLIYDTTGYFKADCRGCSAGTWYGTDGTICFKISCCIINEPKHIRFPFNSNIHNISIIRS